MAKREHIYRYLLIIKFLKAKKRATFEEINKYLEVEEELLDYRLTITKRTFQRDLNDIRSLFGYDIYCFSKGEYQIMESEDESYSQRILEAFDVFNSLSSASSLRPYILTENRKAQGTEHLNNMLQAIRSRKLLHFTHSKYWEEGQTERLVEPYALKEFKGRWYLVALDKGDDKVKTFGLDRISALKTSRLGFILPDGFDAGAYFSHCFGITNPLDQKPEPVVLSFDEEQGNYVKSYPLHSSQRILEDDAGILKVELYLRITYDFMMELLSMGERVRVLSPASLIHQLTDMYSKALNQYEKHQ